MYVYKNTVFNWSVCLLLHTQFFEWSYLWRELRRSVDMSPWTRSDLLVQHKNPTLLVRQVRYSTHHLHDSRYDSYNSWLNISTLPLIPSVIDLGSMTLAVFSSVSCRGSNWWDHGCCIPFTGRNWWMVICTTSFVLWFFFAECIFISNGASLEVSPCGFFVFVCVRFTCFFCTLISVVWL